MKGKHAVVLGGSLAGLFAARVLSDHFERVTLVERDDRSDAPEARKGVPQGRHVHGLLLGGQQIFEKLFPGIVDTMLASGAVDVNQGDEFAWHHFGTWKARYKSAIHGSFASRPFIEHAIAARVATIPNLSAVRSHDVIGLVASDDRRRVRGVRVRDRATSAERTFDADLVIDATGRGSRTPEWLEALGYAKPRKEECRVDGMYATRLFRGVQRDGFKALIVAPTPPATRGAVLFPIEGDLCMLTLVGSLGDHPPTDDAGFMAFAESLPVPAVANAVRNAEPASPIVPFKFPGSQRLYYEDLARAPEGFVVVGDAVCAFNPMYGQGMSVSAFEAMALDACLREDPGAGLAKRTQRAIAKIVGVPWGMVVGEDLRYEQVAGRRTLGMKFLHWYTGRIHQLAGQDPAVAEAFYEVMHFLKPPPALFHPRIALRVLRGGNAQRAADMERMERQAAE